QQQEPVIPASRRSSALVGTLALSLVLASCDRDPAPVRAFEARIATGVAHRPCPASEPALCTPPAQADPGPWVRALREVEDARDPGAAVRWAGLLVSFGADRTSLDRAIARLDSLSAASP